MHQYESNKKKTNQVQQVVRLPDYYQRRIARVEGWVESGISLIGINNEEAIGILKKARKELYKTWNQKKA